MCELKGQITTKKIVEQIIDYNYVEVTKEDFRDLIDFFFLYHETPTKNYKDHIFNTYKVLDHVLKMIAGYDFEIKEKEELSYSPDEIVDYIISNSNDIEFMRENLRDLIDNFFLNSEGHTKESISTYHMTYKVLDDMLKDTKIIKKQRLIMA